MNPAMMLLGGAVIFGAVVGTWAFIRHLVRLMFGVVTVGLSVHEWQRGAQLVGAETPQVLAARRRVLAAQAEMRRVGAL